MCGRRILLEGYINIRVAYIQFWRMFLQIAWAQIKSIRFCYMRKRTSHGEEVKCWYMLKGSDTGAMGSAFSGLVYTMCGFAGRVGQIVRIIWEHCHQRKSLTFWKLGWEQAFPVKPGRRRRRLLIVMRDRVVYYLKVPGRGLLTLNLPLGWRVSFHLRVA